MNTTMSKHNGFTMPAIALATDMAASAQLVRDIEACTRRIEAVTAGIRANRALDRAGYKAAPDLVNGVLCGRVIQAQSRACGKMNISVRYIEGTAGNGHL